MFPLAVVGQGRYELYTIVPIDESRSTSLSLYDHFVNKVKRPPKPDENIKFVVQSGVNLIGSLEDYKDFSKSSALYIRKVDFLPTNTLVLENRGNVFGRGGSGRTQGTVHLNLLQEDRDYISPVTNFSTGGNAIVNDSELVLTVINHGVLAGGGSGGGALGNDTYTTGGWNEQRPDDWWLRLHHGPGGGGAPYGKGGIEDHRAEDFMAGNYDNVIADQAKVVKVVNIVKSEPATLRRLFGNPNIFIMDVWDTDSTKYNLPLSYHPSNYLPPGLTLNFRLKSPVGSTHYNTYKSEIEGPDKDRIIFHKTYYTMYNGGSRYNANESLFTISPPMYLGEDASLTTPGKAGFTYTEHITGRSGFNKGYVPARGGDGGELGRRGKMATMYEDYIMYKSSGTGYITRTIKSIQNDLGLKVSSNIIYSAPSAAPGNPGYLVKGNVLVSNEGAGKTIGRIDTSGIKKAFSQFGSIAALKKFEIIPTEGGILATRVKHVVMSDLMGGQSPVTITDFKISEFSVISDTLDSITLDIKSQTPPGNHSFLAINEYGIHPTLNVTSTKITIGDIYYNMRQYMSPSEPSLVELVLICASAETISNIRSHVAAMKLYGIDWYGRTQ